jgi:hypothetical protein
MCRYCIDLLSNLLLLIICGFVAEIASISLFFYSINGFANV